MIIGVLILLNIVAWLLQNLAWSSLSRDTATTHSYPAAEAPQMAPSASLSRTGGSYEMGEAVLMDAAADYDDSYTQTKSANNGSDVGESETSQKVIKTGRLELEVESVSQTIQEITSYTTNNDGFIADSRVRNYEDGAKYATVIVRLPAQYFEGAMGEFKLMAKSVEEENVSGQDITEEYVDLESRLKNLRLEETQYQEVLKKATKVEDILEVNRYLFSVREDIELIEGRLRYMDNLTDLSTITLQISEETKVRIPTDEWKPLTTLKDAFRGMVVLWQGIINIIIWVVFLLVPIALVVWVVYRLVKKIRNRHNLM